MITVRDMVSRDTPPKNDAAPMRAIAPGSIHFQNFDVGMPPCRSTSRRPMTRPYKPPMKLHQLHVYERVTVLLVTTTNNLIRTRNVLSARDSNENPTAIIPMFSGSGSMTKLRIHEKSMMVAINCK